MNRVFIWVILVSISLVLHTTGSVEVEVRNSLVSFLQKLSNDNDLNDPILGWNSNSDPCKDNWPRVKCNPQNTSVAWLSLAGLNLSGILDAAVLCGTPSLATNLIRLILDGNNIGGVIPGEISKCKKLTYFSVSGNQFSGNLPSSLAMLGNLKKLDISNNKFSGNLPELSRISGLRVFLAQNNLLSGQIPGFYFSNFQKFNVSNNNFSGLIPDGASSVSTSSLLGNPGLCGDPLPAKCPIRKLSEGEGSKGPSKDEILMFSGYAVLACVCLALIIFHLCKGKKRKQTVEAAKKVAAVDDTFTAYSVTSSDYRSGVTRSGYTDVSGESQMASSSLIVLESPVVNGLKFDDLLSAPADLLGRGKYSSLYKVILENRMVLVVKRIKEWEIPSAEFKRRMRRMGQVKHPNVLPAVAFYCSRSEKLLVYEYLPNGSLFGLLHGTPRNQAFDWVSRINIAASVAEALAFMHRALSGDGIAHGNLKSSNILMNNNMDPCISEYGLMDENNGNYSNLIGASASGAFKRDIYRFGVILLELLTGKMVQHNGGDLADWVLSVVREEWTAEVFDKSLILDGASEERMVNLLQVAIKCVDNSLDARPSINQIATMIKAIKDEEDRSISFEQRQD